MERKIDLSGMWSLQLDPKKEGAEPPFSDVIPLPGTTSYYKKGKKNGKAETGFLTEEYPFEGWAWFSRTFEADAELSDKRCFLFLERTRVTTLWLDGEELGTRNSLCAPHVYDVTGRLAPGTHTFVLRVDNAGYLTKGGHMTSPDTQTNWNGVTGRMEIQVFPHAFLSDIRVYSDAVGRAVTVKGTLNGAECGKLTLSAACFNSAHRHTAAPAEFAVVGGQFGVRYLLGPGARLWDEHEPYLYRMRLSLAADGVRDDEETTFGLRDFKTRGGKFTVNGEETFLRGKHDGMIFPLTGFAPTELEPWLKRLKTAQRYGVNHYRFHTCCPPDAAFAAADLLGVYMEPELPFWGTVPAKDDPAADQAEQVYLEAEGFRMLNAFGNHPSFVMMSLGNELWGSSERLNELLGKYRAFDGRHLYTQGSNNFQFTPEILPNDDFFCGVRFSRDRLIRGSYAMCDAPLGHVQTGATGTMTDYDAAIVPPANAQHTETTGGKIQIQYVTGTKTVEAEEQAGDPVPEVPVVSHEIGQYAVYPDFREIEKYTGPLKARNFEVFRRRLKEKRLGSLARRYFVCSGKLAAACYREELEAAFRSERLAGFQLLDLQDYTGQGTALVGMLNAFMEPKGLISAEEWRSFCSDAVLLARFPKYVYVPGEQFLARVQIRYYRKEPLHGLALGWTLRGGEDVLASGRLDAPEAEGHFPTLGEIRLTMPEAGALRKLRLSLCAESLGLKKEYGLWACPADAEVNTEGVNVFDHPSEKMFQLLRAGGSAVIFAKPDTLKNSVEGTYCTDFWCYPMFRFISESMGKPVPAGTMGLLIRSGHPALRGFACEEYSTEPWRSIITASRALVLDETPQAFRPIVQVIDNFERNHKLGILFECRVLNGNLLVCTCDFPKITGRPEGRQFLSGLLNYARSKEFNPTAALTVSTVKKIFA